MSQNNPYSGDGAQPDSLQPPIPRPSGNSSTALIIVALLVGGGFIVLVCGGVIVGLTLPAVQAAREAARRMQCMNNEKQIALAFHNYHSAYKSFPPAFTVDGNGNPLHSWRTLILPFVEQKALYDQIDLSKPWDDPVNLPFSELDLAVYKCPSTMLGPGMTTYVAIVDAQGIMSGPQATAMKDISDGTSNTLLIVETNEASAVNWMSPQDTDVLQFDCQSNHPGGCNCALADGSVQFLSTSVDPNALGEMVTKDGGEVSAGLGY